VRLCVIKELQQTVTLALSYAAALQKESNIQFTYRHSNCSRRLLPAPRQCGFFSLWAFIGKISELAVRVEGKYNFTGTLEMCAGTFFSPNCNKVLTLENRTPFCRP